MLGRPVSMYPLGRTEPGLVGTIVFDRIEVGLVGLVTERIDIGLVGAAVTDRTTPFSLRQLQYLAPSATLSFHRCPLISVFS